MPKRTDISSILIIGAGPIVIGQACEFDYSGTQACKALKEEGYRVILVNSNPATIMTDPNLADATYIEPINTEMLEKIIIVERPDAILPTMGGQTGLNAALNLETSGILNKYNIELIGAKKDAIEMAEDRKKFRNAMLDIGIENPRAIIAESMDEAIKGLEEIGLPAIIRPAFTMGGTGGGVAYNKEDFISICKNGLDASPSNQILIDESLIGWKEYEMEVVRDRMDNAIIVCSIENIDPMGVHTGDSITIAPALTLTDKEYQIMRSQSINVLRKIGVETGGSNVQWAINPKDGRMVIIEMNPRVSRSSALASKATGFPIAKIAAKLAIGYTLDELDNDITKVTPASFEPSIDYIVTKIPRFAFEKFPGADVSLTTSMKSVGEVMSIGRSIHESLQKALSSLETGFCGFDELMPIPVNKDVIRAELYKKTPERILFIAQAIRMDITKSEINQITHYDPWFLDRIEEIVDQERTLVLRGLPKHPDVLQEIKSMGFTDKKISQLTKCSETSVRTLREKMKVFPVFKRIDTCAGEFEAQTPYMYSTYEVGPFMDQECEARPTDNKKIIILGGGPNRIGQGIEFDYCCCHACFALSRAGYETIMVNCNPETVSTDYDTSDRLYFEPLTLESVLEIIRVEKRTGILLGVIVQLGGQTPLNLARDLEASGVTILGTSTNSIDMAEDREQFQKLVEKLGMKQPLNGTAVSGSQAASIAKKIGFPIVIRPSYVLGGRAMEKVTDVEQLTKYMKEATGVSKTSPLLLDSYLSNAIEVDVDAISDGFDVYVAGVMEHIEEAGVHSGDSACSLPPHSLSESIITQIEKQTRMLALELNVIGLINIQFAVKDSLIYIIEVNPRASRTVPFVAKATGLPLAAIAARVMAGEHLNVFGLVKPKLKHIAVKEAVLPFDRFPGVDTILSPEMRSTGEVMGLDTTFEKAFLKSQLAAGIQLPQNGKVFISIKDNDKKKPIIKASQILSDLGFQILATKGTSKFLNKNGIKAETINKVSEGRPNIVDLLKDKAVGLVFNTTEGHQSLEDSKEIRSISLRQKIPYYTTSAGCNAAARAIQANRDGNISVYKLQDLIQNNNTIDV